MEKFGEYRERMHRQGFVVPSANRKTYKIPEQYKKFIGVMSDGALFLNFYEHKGESVHGKWVSWVDEHEPLFSVEELEHIVEACNGSKTLISYLLSECSFIGIDKIREMTTADFEEQEGVGKKKLDALVAIGVKDVRTRKTRAPFMINGWFSGTVDGVKVHGHIDGEYLSGREV